MRGRVQSIRYGALLWLNHARIQPWFDDAIQPARMQPWFDAIQPSCWSYANDDDDDDDDDEWCCCSFFARVLCSCIDQWMWVNKLPKFHVKSLPKIK
jgi:hypothetical protein